MARKRKKGRKRRTRRKVREWEEKIENLYGLWVILKNIIVFIL